VLPTADELACASARLDWASLDEAVGAGLDRAEPESLALNGEGAFEPEAEAEGGDVSDGLTSADVLASTETVVLASALEAPSEELALVSADAAEEVGAAPPVPLGS
jgi:hypothetical protein